jgi:NTP pyrophosphatase (non-canonical NTP hydrolase)
MVTLKEFQEHTKELARVFPDTTVEQRVLFLVTEVGEVTREVLHLSGAYSSHGAVDAGAATERLGMELYDVLWNLCDLANRLNIDLEGACARKIALNQARQWRKP